jgi:DNA polymerase-3 subunit delta
MSAAKRNTRKRVTPHEVRTSARSEKPAPFYLFHGEESYGRERLYRQALEALRPEVAPDFNVDIFHGDNVDPERLLEIYNSYPMMAPRRVVVLRDADRLPAAQAKDLEPLVESPAETSIFVATGAKLDMRRKLFQQMGRQGMAVEFRVPFDNKLPEVIGEMASERGLTLAPEAVDLLRLYVGSQLAEMDNELEKLSIYVGDRADTRVSARDVEELVGLTRGSSVFEFTDAVGRGDRPAAVALLQSLLDQGEEPHRLVPLLTRHLQLLPRRLPQAGPCGQRGPALARADGPAACRRPAQERRRARALSGDHGSLPGGADALGTTGNPHHKGLTAFSHHSILCFRGK